MNGPENDPQNDPQNGDGAVDELGLATTAWKLRTTLAEAVDIDLTDLTESADDGVLAGIRQRSLHRRRTRRAVGTTAAAFCLSITTLALIAGGGRAVTQIDQLARAIDPPVAMPGGRGSDEEESTDPDGTDARRNGTGRGSSSQVAAGECRSSDEQRYGGACEPSSVGDGSGNGPVDGVTGCVADDAACLQARAGDPTNSSLVEPAPGGGVATTRTTRGPGQPPQATTTMGPSETVPQITVPPTTLAPPPTRQVQCGAVKAGQAPSNPTCLSDAYANGQAANFRAVYNDLNGRKMRTTFNLSADRVLRVVTATDLPDPAAVGVTVVCKDTAPVPIAVAPWYTGCA